MQIKTINISELKENNYNPNEMSEEKYNALVNNIKKFGYLQPVLITPDNIICDGAHRVRACKEAGIDKIQCVVYQGNGDIKEYRKLLTLSMNNLRGVNVDEKFEDVIKDLAYNIDYEELEKLTGFDVNTISDIIQKDKYDDEGEDDVPEMEECLVIKEGDIIELGQHRLMCGDSTIKDNVDKLMNGNKADMLFTDPPYNVASESRNYASDVSKSMNDLKNSDWDKDFNIDKTIKIIKEYNDITVYMWTSQFLINEIWKGFKSWGNYIGYIVWNKPNPMPSLSKRHPTWNTELCAYITKGKRIVNFPEYGHFYSCITTNKKSDGTHPTQKPIEVIEPFVKFNSNMNSIIIDLFFGSGSTLIACEKTGRICYGMEIDQHYCSVIIERYCKYVDNYNIKVNGKEVDWNKYKAGI